MKDTQTKIAELSNVAKLSSDDIKFIYRSMLRDMPQNLRVINDRIRTIHSFTDKDSLSIIIEKLREEKLKITDKDYVYNKNEYTKYINSIRKIIREPEIEPSENFSKVIENVLNIINFTGVELTEYCNIINAMPQLEKLYVFSFIIDKCIDTEIDTPPILGELIRNITSTINNVFNLVEFIMIKDSITIDYKLNSDYNKYVLYLLHCIDSKFIPLNPAIDYVKMKNVIIGNLYHIYYMNYTNKKEVDVIHELLLMIASYTGLPSFTQYNRMIAITEFV